MDNPFKIRNKYAMQDLNALLDNFDMAEEYYVTNRTPLDIPRKYVLMERKDGKQLTSELCPVGLSLFIGGMAFQKGTLAPKR